MSASRSRPHVGWIAFACAAVIVLALGKSRRRVIVSATFALLAAALTMLFVGAWFFTPLDTDPHSSMTAIVFAFAPVWSLLVAIIGSGLTWFAVRTK